MNILDALDEIMGIPNTFIQILPDKPDELIGLFEYSSVPPDHYFGSVLQTFSVQVRARAKKQDDARALAELAAQKLSQYDCEQFSIRQISNCIPIGQDQANPPRWEFTVSFNVLMK